MDLDDDVDERLIISPSSIVEKYIATYSGDIVYYPNTAQAQTIIPMVGDDSKIYVHVTINANANDSDPKIILKFKGDKSITIYPNGAYIIVPDDGMLDIMSEYGYKYKVDSDGVVTCSILIPIWQGYNDNIKSSSIDVTTISSIKEREPCIKIMPGLIILKTVQQPS